MLLKNFVNPKAKPIIPETEITIKILFKNEEKKGRLVFCVVMVLISHVSELDYEGYDSDSDEDKRYVIPDGDYRVIPSRSACRVENAESYDSRDYQNQEVNEQIYHVNQFFSILFLVQFFNCIVLIYNSSLIFRLFP